MIIITVHSCSAQVMVALRSQRFCSLKRLSWRCGVSIWPIRLATLVKIGTKVCHINNCNSWCTTWYCCIYCDNSFIANVYISVPTFSGAQIGTAIYNCGLLCGIVIPIYFLIGATYPLLVLWLRAITTFFVSTSSIVLLYSNRYSCIFCLCLVIHWSFRF